MSNQNKTHTRKDKKTPLEELQLHFEHTEDNRTVIHNGKVVKYHLPRHVRPH